MLSDAIFTASWLITGLVAAYDTYLSVKYQEFLPELESNPVCRMLITLDGGSVAAMLGCKFAGTVLVLGCMGLTYRVRRRVGLPVAVTLAAIQLALLAYLTLATPTIGSTH